MARYPKGTQDILTLALLASLGLSDNDDPDSPPPAGAAGVNEIAVSEVEEIALHLYSTKPGPGASDYLLGKKEQWSADVAAIAKHFAEHASACTHEGCTKERYDLFVNIANTGERINADTWAKMRERAQAA